MCGVGAKSVAHLMKFHLLQWEVIKVKFLINSNMSLTVLNLHQKTDPKVLYLFGILRRFQHYTGYITTGSWKGRGNQYIQFARVVYCKIADQRQATTSFPT